jgi:hypothetical protein
MIFSQMEKLSIDVRSGGRMEGNAHVREDGR